MKEREKVIATGLVTLMLLTWLGFPFHTSERFAGSLWGGVLAVTGSLLMLVPLVYLVVKRNRRLKQWVIRRVSTRTLLTWHIYAGVLGPILVVAHSGHKYESTLGILLTAMTLLLVVSGFVGRYLMSGFSTEIREKTQMLKGLQDVYARTARELSARPETKPMVRSDARPAARLLTGLLSPAPVVGLSVPSVATVADVTNLVESMADLEYAIRTHEIFKRWFGRWLRFHIVFSCFLYLLMFLHIYFAVYFGLRWFE